MAKRDYYETLGVGPEASNADLKKAYRRQAMKFHPDRNPDDASAEESFKAAKEAYDVLGDAQKRSTYDQFGHAGLEQGGGSPGPGGMGDVFDSVFGDMFGGGGRGGNRVYRGSDLSYDLELSLEDAVSGTEVKIRVPNLIGCEKCDGSGSRNKSAPVTCGMCGGVGQVRAQQGFFSVQQTCPTCRGAGKTIKDPCRPCQGTGTVRGQKTISVKVPAGVDNGDRIRLSGEGEKGQNNGPSGDLYVNIGVRKHSIFHRDGNNLQCEVPIGFVIAVLGGELEVPTLNGRLSLKIPAETQTGSQFRLRGKGVKSVRGGAVGDLICRVIVETPVSLTTKQKALLKEFSGTLSKNSKHSPRAVTWLNGVKKFFDELI